MELPIKMSRPIRVLFRTGNFDGAWPCDVPCEYTTSESIHHEKDSIDVLVGEGGPPSISAEMRRNNPSLATAARSMESAINYPTLASLPEQVDVPMTTSLRTSVVPVVYLSRSSIVKWGEAPVAWNSSMLRAHYGAGSGSTGGGIGGGSSPGGGGVSSAAGSSSSAGSSRQAAAAVFVARNCHSKNGREETVKRLAKLLRGGVDRPGLCLNTHPWPKCTADGGAKGAAGSTSSKGVAGGVSKAAGDRKCGKHALLRRYPFYLAFENSDEPDYVSEKVFHALEAGVLPIYNGAPNIADFVPSHSVVDLKAFGGSLDKLAAHLHELLESPERYAAYFRWKQSADGLPEAFQARFGFVNTHAKCRLCRWAYSRKYGLPWDRRTQRPKPTSGGTWF